MKEISRHYKELCEAYFDKNDPQEDYSIILVYTGEKDEERPVFRVVWAADYAKVRIGSCGKEYWGIVAFDPKVCESQWYNYNDCVSLENWAVLDRLLESRFRWMVLNNPELVYETRICAKAQLADAVSKMAELPEEDE